jgi:ribosomal-protein-alanine N-acetyltransferase
MLTINFNPFPVLETERLVLRRPEMEDVNEMFLHRSNPDLMKYIQHRLVTKREQVENAMNNVHGFIDRNESINWAITLKGDNKPIGMVGYVRFSPEHYRAEIGYIVHTPYHGKGMAQEATQAVVDYGFHVMGLHSIEAVINHENEASKKLVERMGFTKDAFFKDYLYHGGKFMSANVYSLIKEEK